MIRNSLHSKSISLRRSTVGNVKCLLVINLKGRLQIRLIFMLVLCTWSLFAFNHFNCGACRTKRSWSRPKRTLVFDTLWSELTKRYQHIPFTTGKRWWYRTDAKYPSKSSSLFQWKRNHWSHCFLPVFCSVLPVFCP